MTTSTQTIHTPPGHTIHQWRATHGPSRLCRSNTGTLQIWHRFGSVGWMHLADVDTSGARPQIQTVDSWINHPWPYPIDLAHREVTHAIDLGL